MRRVNDRAMTPYHSGVVNLREPYKPSLPLGNLGSQTDNRISPQDIVTVVTIRFVYSYLGISDC